MLIAVEQPLQVQVSVVPVSNTKPNENSITTIINNLGKKILEQSMNEISKIKIL